MSALITTLSETPEQGVALGNGFYKIRLSIASKGKGKVRGCQGITYVKVIASTVYLSSIFDKGEKDTIDTKELEKIFSLIP